MAQLKITDNAFQMFADNTAKTAKTYATADNARKAVKKYFDTRMKDYQGIPFRIMLLATDDGRFMPCIKLTGEQVYMASALVTKSGFCVLAN